VCSYDPRLVNDRLLLGLKGTMSEYELSLMRQRGIAARDSKARRGEYQFMLPPGLCWSEAGKIELDPDAHVADTIRGVVQNGRFMGYIESDQSPANHGIPRFACNPDLNHAETRVHLAATTPGVSGAFLDEATRPAIRPVALQTRNDKVRVGR